MSSICRITGTAYSPVAAGSPGPFDRKKPSGSCDHHLVEARPGRDDRHPRPGLDQIAEDVALGAIIDRDDVGRRLPRRRSGRAGARPMRQPSPFVRASRASRSHTPAQPPLAAGPRLELLAADLLRQVHPLEPRPLRRLLAQRLQVELARRRDARTPSSAAPRAAPAGSARACRRPTPRSARSPPSSSGNPASSGSCSGEVTASRTRQPERMRLARLDVLLIGADIADVREGERDDLPRVARVGHHFLVTGHRGVEAQFADRAALGPEAPAPDRRARRRTRHARRPLGTRGRGAWDRPRREAPAA